MCFTHYYSSPGVCSWTLLEIRCCTRWILGLSQYSCSYVFLFLLRKTWSAAPPASAASECDHMEIGCLGTFAFWDFPRPRRGNVTTQSPFPLLSNARPTGLHRRSLSNEILDQWELMVLAILDLIFFLSAVWIRLISGGEFMVGNTE